MKDSEQLKAEYYLDRLQALKTLADSIPNTPLLAAAKINALIVLNMRYERVAFDRDLARHPFMLVAEFIDDAIRMLTAWQEAAFIEDENKRVVYPRKSTQREEKHQQLFQDLWVNFSEEDYRERVERYAHRLRACLEKVS